MACAKMLYGSSRSNMILEVYLYIFVVMCSSMLLMTVVLMLSVNKSKTLPELKSCLAQELNSLFLTKLIIWPMLLNLLFVEVIHFISSHFVVIEKYSKNTRFCLICNYVSEIIPALQSRCTRFRFQPLNSNLIRDRLMYIIGEEK